MLKQLAAVGKQFRLSGYIDTYRVITHGNINVTCKVTYRQPDGSAKSYIMQRVNTRVFRHPKQVMDNIDLVTTYIREHYPDACTPYYYHTASGENYMLNQDGSFWRVTDWMDSVTFDSSDDPTVITETGKAFGRFQMQLAGFDGSRLYETIPDFHNTGKHLENLFAHAKADPCQRAEDVKEELAYLASVREKASALRLRYAAGEFPVRVTHNDTKCNNVLFDRETLRAVAVIDLDTVMPGMAMYDFGDAVRFLANTAAEDEPDIAKVQFDAGKFTAFCKGFLPQVYRGLTEPELSALVQAAFSITIEQAARFLDDYLCGDTYFKICYPEHNLARTRCQLALAQDIDRKSGELTRIVFDTLSELRRHG